MGASQSCEPDVHVPDAEEPEPEDDEDLEDAFDEPDDIRWLWPFI